MSANTAGDSVNVAVDEAGGEVICRRLLEYMHKEVEWKS